MNVSTTQLNTTASHEGFVATPYKDGSTGSVQNYSIGYGHQIQANERSLLTKITKAQALELLRKDMQNVVNYVNANSKKSLNQNQFDALCDFGFNCGTGALGSVLAQLNTVGYSAAAAKISQFVYYHPVANGPAVLNQTLVKRRAEEVAIFNGTAGYSIITIIVLLAVMAAGYYWLDTNKIPFEKEVHMFI
jgi:lysozyme